MRIAGVGIGVLLALALSTGQALAQGTTATLKGHVVDPDGAPLPGVAVTVSAASIQAPARTGITDAEGAYRLLLLQPADDYVISIRYPGFAAVEVGPLDLDAGRTLLQDVTLRSAEELASYVEVVASGTKVDLAETWSSTTYNRDYIEGLPVIGRNYQDILTLTPGVTDTDGDGNPNVQGARQTGLQYRLDGGNVTDPASGTFGQNFNSDAIEAIEMITAGASAEYGRADGGFTNIITRSGANEFEGRSRLYWRGRLLDGNGAGENADIVYRGTPPETNLRSLSAYLTLGGPVLRDRLWYFVSGLRIEKHEPISLAGASLDRSVRARGTFAKLSWQVSADSKLALQYSDDPARFTGGFLDLGVSKDSDAVQDQGGRTWQMKWTFIASPSLLMETGLLRYDSGLAVTPVSGRFEPLGVESRVVRYGGTVSLQAAYPYQACSLDGTISGFVENCDAGAGPLSIYQRNLRTGAVTGPFPFRSDDSRTRDEIRTTLTHTAESAWGEHEIKAGVEFAREAYEDHPLSNPYFRNDFEPCRGCRDEVGQPIANAVTGTQILTVFSPSSLAQRVTGFDSSAFVTDTWKPRPNVAVGLGLRLDHEAMDSSGYGWFDPSSEKRRYNAIVESLCGDALRVRNAGGASNWSSTCDPKSGFVPGGPPANANLVYAMDRDTPERLRRFDRDADGIFDSGVDGTVWAEALTNYPDRLPENFEITNLNLSPRFSISWDPRADGKMKLYATWGRYHDRLFLDTVRYEAGPDSIDYVFEPDPVRHVFDEELVSRRASAVSVHQIDRDLATPRTDVFTAGLERELAPEWTVSLTYTQRLAWGLLQDVDVNHLQCEEFGGMFGISPASICPAFTDSRGRVHLSRDLFGGLDGTPNVAPDLYNVNPNFNQILRIGNFNSSRYRSVEMSLLRRFLKGWQMRLSYTYSRAQGQAEEFVSALGNDPSTRDDEAGFLDYDQRHRVVFTMTTRLPKGVDVGGVMRWESGTPWSVISQVDDADNAGNVTYRTFYPTGRRNDQRNGGSWSFDGRLSRSFQLAGVQASAELTVENLFASDDATIGAYRLSSDGGVQLLGGPQGLRRFGRIWEAGMTLSF